MLFTFDFKRLGVSIDRKNDKLVDGNTFKFSNVFKLMNKLLYSAFNTYN